MATLTKHIEDTHADTDRELLVEDYHVSEDAPDEELNKAHIERCDELIFSGLVTF